MLRSKMLAAAVCAVAITGASASAAFAGEVTGPPGSVGNPGTPKDMSHANSICAFSGLNDYVNGPTDFHVQSYGQDVRAGRADPTDKTQPFPGNSCQGGSNPYHP
jgi:hypothetical protein